METAQFKTKIKNGVSEVSKQYQGQFKQDNLSVILLSEGTKAKAINYLDELMAHPLKVKMFRLLSREDGRARN